MRIYLATDHAGFELKEKIKDFLKKEGFELEDCGAYEYDKDDDYPDFISKAAEAVSKDPENSMAIVLGGSGQGEAIVANKFKNVRCSIFYGPLVPAEASDISGRISEDPFEILRLTRAHNNSNALSLGARFLTEDQALKAVKFFLETPYTGEERHKRRINKVKEIEKNIL